MNNNLSIRIGILTASLCLFSCDDPPPSNPGPSAEMSSQAKLAADMNKMVRAQALSMTEAEQRGVTLTDTNAIAEYVDVLLSKKMSAGLAKGFFFGGAQGVKNRHPIPAYSNLKAIKTDQGVTYALRKPCNEDEAIEVTAWWTNKAVSVCPDVVRPEVIGDDQGRTCGASVLNPATTDICGCGPRLMWCTPNDKVRNALKMSLQVEVDKTVAKIVNDNMPVETLFTSNSTVRGRVAEFVYRRARVAAGEDPELLDLTDFPEEGEYWKERHEQVPGHHAGILTAPAVIYGSDALRGVIWTTSSMEWQDIPFIAFTHRRRASPSVRAPRRTPPKSASSRRPCLRAG